MRKSPVALFSGIGRQAVWMAVVCGLGVMALAVLLQADRLHHQYRDMHQQQLRQAALQTAQITRSRIDRAAILLRAQVDAGGRGVITAPAVMTQLDRIPAFGEVTVVPTAQAVFKADGQAFEVGPRERDALAAGGTVLLSAHAADAAAALYLLRAVGSVEKPVWVLASLRDDWLWTELGTPYAHVAVFDSTGQRHFSQGASSTEINNLVIGRLPGLPANGVSTDLAWKQGTDAWVGAMARINSASTISTLTLAVVTMEPDRPWSAAFWSALRSQLVLVPVLLLLAGLSAQVFAARLVRPLRQLRRVIGQLPDRRLQLQLQVVPHQPVEVQELVETYNRTAEAIETQNAMRRVLDELDALLLPGGDYENVIDQVLTRVRAVTRANNVGLALVDPGITGHGRLYVVNAEGGAPVNRVLLDPDLVASLREAEGGLTISRCEPGRHGFLEPLQLAGSCHFLVWPVMTSDELAAILAVGYQTPPPHAARIADTGTLCAQRLGLSLSNNVRTERLYRQAHFDPLTQLPNRQLFREQMQHELDQARRSGASGALLYIDLDHFKRINDSLGHEAGDKLLAVVAHRLQGCVKDEDTVARLGGDEFTVILRNVSEKNEVGAIADRIVMAMRQPMWLGGRDHHVHASIGITLFPEDGADLDQLLHHADLAMYRAKDLGRSGAVFYSATIENSRARIADSGLYRAIKQREFALYFQPLFRISDGGLTSIEALLRWHRPREGVVSPAEFIPAAEESGAIVDIGVWAIEAACAQISQWREAGMTVPRVALNLSLQQLRDANLAIEVRRNLDKHGLQPDAIEFEMNEAALTDAGAAPGVQALSELGVRLTLDDFGTGSTALGNLMRYPVSAVKIDRSFVARLAESHSAAALADTMIVMAHSQSKLVIAEGVETLEQLEYLREHGCDVAQGFFLARPLSAQDMADLLLGRRDRAGRSAFA
jgi:diguanylate cyclase (GGDEF)-like protein